jgi:hypothetical protein
MSFKKNKYTVIKEAISKDLAMFLYNYFTIKRNVATILFREKYISPYEKCFGQWDDPQAPNTYSHYADIAFETLLLKLNNPMNKRTKLDLVPTYSYARLYKKGDELEIHTDRPSCQISTTINLGGDVWPIFLKTKEGKNKKIILNPGDMLIYRGNELEHWREKFEGEECCQAFLHYQDKNSKEVKLNIYDGRETLGLPSYFGKR